MDSNPLLQRAPLGRCLAMRSKRVFLCSLVSVLKTNLRQSTVYENYKVHPIVDKTSIKERGHTLPPGGVTYGKANYKTDSGTGDINREKLNYRICTLVVRFCLRNFPDK